MKAIDIKKDIHLLIDTIENENLLNNFHDLLLESFSKEKDSLIESNLLSNDEIENWDLNLSEQELESIARGLQDLKEGKFISHDVVMKKYEKYL